LNTAPFPLVVDAPQGRAVGTEGTGKHELSQMRMCRSTLHCLAALEYRQKKLKKTASRLSRRSLKSISVSGRCRLPFYESHAIKLIVLKLVPNWHTAESCMFTNRTDGRETCRNSDNRNAINRLTKIVSDRTVKLNDAYGQKCLPKQHDL